MRYSNNREEELKNKIANDYFWLYDSTKIIGNVDFCVRMHQSTKELFEQESLLWAEAKKGKSNIYHSFVQLILTIGKARTFDKFLPPAFLGAFDGEKMAFIPYNEIHDVFYINDFNWNVTPSNHQTKEFRLILDKVTKILDKQTLLFGYEKDDKELKKFIKNNFIVGRFGLTKTRIDKNNFMVIYNKWLQAVKPSIAVNWEIAKKTGIIDGYFYLADLLSQDNKTIKEKLYVLLKKDHYILDRKLDETGMFSSKRTNFTDKQKAHNQFWNKYERPPKEEYWEYIIDRQDLLVPQDIRERKGSFYTPAIWVELSQKYIADVLGENWQDEYYVWDCAAGTGNLLVGLTNKYNIWASTLDKADVAVMKDRIKTGANMLEKHVFQFDFLNDDFSKLPQPLQEIIANPEKRKKLLIYINPPYAEARGEQKGKSNLRGVNISKQQLKVNVGKAGIELFSQFLIRIYNEIPNCLIGEFSKLKTLNAPNFRRFRSFFLAKLESCFVVPAYTFDNVKGSFPIGFKIWNTDKKVFFNQICADVYSKSADLIQQYTYYNYDGLKFINDWIKKYNGNPQENIGGLIPRTNDFQHQKFVMIVDTKNLFGGSTKFYINQCNLIQTAIYFAVRHCISATWLNDRDQFLYPQDGWQEDSEFQNDCLAYTLFHGQNRITAKEGTNHWIPFTEAEVNAQEKFESHFMSDFISGKIKTNKTPTLFTSQHSPSQHSPSLRAEDTNSPSLRGLGGVKSSKTPITSELLKNNNINTKGLLFSDRFLPYNPTLKEKSRKLRKDRNLAEVLLWKYLQAGRFLEFSFHRQKPILNFIVDFYCKELCLVIEIDGSSHDTAESVALDAERDRQLKLLGLTVLRVSDKEVKINIQNVLRKIEDVVRGIDISDIYREGEQTPPCPLKEGEWSPLVFSTEAETVFTTGKTLWKYYHRQRNCSVNASLYDIRERFQGRNEKGRMNSKSDDETYTRLITYLRDKLKSLAQKIEPKVYEYGFLKI